MSKVLLEYINKNKKDFIKLLIFILIGIILGVILFEIVLNSNEKDELKDFVFNTHNLLKQNENINYIGLLKESIKNNLLTILLIGIFGFVIIGNILIYSMLLYKGVILGFTIACLINTFGVSLTFFIMLIALTLQNIIMIPIVLLLSEKSSKLYKNIIIKKVTMREELCKHIIIMLILFSLGIVSSLIEIYISMNFLIVF